MENSILNSVKQQLGLAEDYNAFDPELIIHINSVLLVTYQLGVGPDKPFSISGPDETWDDFFADKQVINLVKTYVYMKVRLIFDPPNSGVLHEALERQISELEWRLNVQAETPAYGGVGDG